MITTNCMVSVMITPDIPAMAVYAITTRQEITAASRYAISKDSLSKVAIPTNWAASKKKKIKMFTPLTVVENPATSSPGLAFLVATVAHFGESGDYTYLDF